MQKKTKWIVLIAIALIAALFYFKNTRYIDVNNRLCPVSGHSVNDVDTQVYKGKKYRLCSSKCKEELSRNGSDYLPNQ